MPGELARGLELGEAVGVTLLEGGDGRGEVEFAGLERGPEVVGEDLGVKALVWAEALVFADGVVDAARLLDVSAHDDAVLELGFADAAFEEFEHADLQKLWVSGLDQKSMY